MNQRKSVQKKKLTNTLRQNINTVTEELVSSEDTRVG